MLYGFIALGRRGGLSTLLAGALFIPILLNTASSMGTIGDHRFRGPTLSLSLLLQLFGPYALSFLGSISEGALMDQSALPVGSIGRAEGKEIIFALDRLQVKEVSLWGVAVQRLNRQK